MSIVDGTGAVVAEYEYDPYGNIISATGALAEVNPLRYRGYVYDQECSLYYLQSRYYDAKVCRFLNADAFASTGQGIIGNNMFAYCGNNPVVRMDSVGCKWVYELEEIETTLVEESDGGTTYETRIKYTQSEEYLLPWLFDNSTPEEHEVTLVFFVSNEGAVAFDNKQKNAHVLKAKCLREALAAEMYTTCTEQISESLSWRSVEGIAYELYWHYECYARNIFSRSARFANIGSMQEGKPAYDDNAWIFEGM